MLLSTQQKYIISVLRQIRYIRSCQLCALTAQHYRPQGIEISAPHGRYAASTASWNKFCAASGRHSVLRKVHGRSPVLRGHRRHAGTERL